MRSLAARIDAVALDQRERGNAGRAVRLHRLALRLAARGSAARIANNLGVACKAAGRLDEAAGAYARAVALLEGLRTPDPALHAGLLHNLGGLEHARRRPAAGEPLARRGLALRRQLVGADHADFAADLSALAALVDAQGRLDEAEAMYRRALAIFDRAPEPRPRDVAVTRRNLALLRDRLGCDSVPDVGTESHPGRAGAAT